MQRLASVVLLGFIVFGLSKCNLFGPTVGEVMTRHLEEKYGGSFEYLNPVGGRLGQKEQRGRLRTDLFPENTLLVDISYDEDGNEIFRDNFTALLLRDQVVALLEEAPDRDTGHNYQGPWLLRGSFYLKKDFGYTLHDSEWQEEFWAARRERRDSQAG